MLSYTFDLKYVVNSLRNAVLEHSFRRMLGKVIQQNRNYNYFVNQSGIHEWGKQHSVYFQKMIDRKGSCQATSEELYELETLDFYAGYFSQPMNDLLRGKTLYQNEDYVKPYISGLDSIIAKFETPENILAVRRMPCSYVDRRYSEGSFFTERGFLSTSLDLSYRKDDNGNDSLLNQEALLLLKIPKGTKAVYLEAAQLPDKRREEYELLVQRNSLISVERNVSIFGNKVLVARLQNCN